MSRRTCAFALLSAMLVAISGTSTARAERFAPSVAVGGVEFELRGEGLLRFKRILPVYDAALYLPPGTRAPFEADTPMRLEVVYRVGTEAIRFARAGQEVLARNFPAEQLATIETRLARINALYPDPRRGDRCSITYIPGVGTELRFNGEQLGIIEGAEFARMYFSIWLGEDPASPRLRRDLLAGRGA